MGESMIEKLVFGRTGHNSTRAIFGAAAFGGVTQEEADQTLEVLLQYGVNHIDTAASYGHSEERIGPWMAAHRDKFFLATKTGERTYEKAREQIHRSLERLQTSQLDLIQLHCLIEPQEWETALGSGGALQACIEARDEGLVRFIGVTGHGVNVAKMHKRALERFDFDSVLLPYNLPMMQNESYAADFEELIAICGEKNVAVQTIKGICRGPWHDKQRFAATWYEPLREQDDITAAVNWVLDRPGIYLNTAGDIHLLPKVLEAAARHNGNSDAPGEEAQRELEAMELEPLFV